MVDSQTVAIDPAEVPRLRVGLKWDAIEKDAFGASHGLSSTSGLHLRRVIASVCSGFSGLTAALLKMTGLFPTAANKFSRSKKHYAASVDTMTEYLEHGEARSCDLDLLCYCYDQDGKLVSLVAPHTTGLEGTSVAKAAIIHSGDESTGLSSGYDEEILVTFANLDDNIQYIFLAVFSVDHNFDEIPGGQCAIMSRLDEQMLLERDLRKEAHQTYIFAKLTRTNAGWELQDVSDYCNVNEDPDAHLDGTIDDVLRYKYLNVTA